MARSSAWASGGVNALAVSIGDIVVIGHSRMLDVLVSAIATARAKVQMGDTVKVLPFHESLSNPGTAFIASQCGVTVPTSLSGQECQKPTTMNSSGVDG